MSIVRTQKTKTSHYRLIKHPEYHPADVKDLKCLRNEVSNEFKFNALYCIKLFQLSSPVLSNFFSLIWFSVLWCFHVFKPSFGPLFIVVLPQAWPVILWYLFNSGSFSVGKYFFCCSSFKLNHHSHFLSPDLVNGYLVL